MGDDFAATRDSYALLCGTWDDCTPGEGNSAAWLVIL